ncbi:MAG: polysaccharide biosynthesis protein [Marmoricola sp.]
MTVLRVLRPMLQRLFDLGAWVLSYGAMAWIQVAVGYGPESQIEPSLLIGLCCGAAFLLFTMPLRLHDGRSPIGSFDDAVLTGVVGGLVSLLGLVATSYADSVRLSVGVTGPMCALVLLLGSRAVYRVVRDATLLRSVGARRADREPVLVIGAGNGAKQLVGDMMREPRCRWRPVALLDDDPYRRHRRIAGVPVVGPTAALEAVTERLGVRTVILAIPSASAGLVQQFNQRAREGSLDLKVLPSVNDLGNPAHVKIEDVRDIDVSDFLGRQQIETDIHTIADYLTGKVVLVTGAGGSIGSELCRQISRFGPAELIMLDRDESALHGVQLSLEGRALLDSDDVVLGDIRDERFVDELFRRRRPDVVFHAAALKHLPLLESGPGEAVKTNVWGTQTVLRAAVAAGVDRFVNISTDKAADPTSVLGHSKRLAEGLTSAAALDGAGQFMSVRFGNVLGSRGSVLTTFTAQIARGGPVTVTDPRVTRFFMTIAEAVQLVIQAGAIGRDGDALVLDMGDPVSIQAVAEQLIDMSGKSVEIVYTGLRDGEKLHEQLFSDGEADRRPFHPLISHVPVPPFSPSDAARLDPYRHQSEVIRVLEECSAGMRVRSGAERSRQVSTGGAD